jgi:GNAT superfamily N-acetyltransferase
MTPISEAFEDHWEHHHQPFAEWWRLRTGDPEFDISWWFTVCEGDRTIAAIRNVPARNGGVFVATLGVRRAWRGHGLAKALLRHTFARAWEAGFPRITLHVDASSPTGATALYRGVGMNHGAGELGVRETPAGPAAGNRDLRSRSLGLAASASHGFSNPASVRVVAPSTDRT